MQALQGGPHCYAPWQSSGSAPRPHVCGLSPHILSTQAPSSPFPVFAKPSFDSNPTGFHSALPRYQLATMFTSLFASMLAPTSMFPPPLPTLQDKSRSQSQYTWMPPSTLPQIGLVCGFGQTASLLYTGFCIYKTRLNKPPPQSVAVKIKLHGPRAVNTTPGPQVERHTRELLLSLLGPHH